MVCCMLLSHTVCFRQLNSSRACFSVGARHIWRPVNSLRYVCTSSYCMVAGADAQRLDHFLAGHSISLQQQSLSAAPADMSSGLPPQSAYTSPTTATTGGKHECAAEPPSDFQPDCEVRTVAASPPMVTAIPPSAGSHTATIDPVLQRGTHSVQV